MKDTCFYIYQAYSFMQDNKIHITKTEILSDQWYTLKKVTYDKTMHNGSVRTQSREAYDRGNGAAILLYDKERKTVILTRQFRLPSFLNGNPTGMLIEVCAGLLDNDDPEACIKRETEEETGYKISHVEKVFEAYMSPGAVTEILYCFIAEYAKEMKTAEGGGLEEEGEDIEVLEFGYEDALRMVDTGEIRDAKTIMLIQHLRIKNIL